MLIHMFHRNQILISKVSMQRQSMFYHTLQWKPRWLIHTLQVEKEKVGNPQTSFQDIEKGEKLLVPNVDPQVSWKSNSY